MPQLAQSHWQQLWEVESDIGGMAAAKPVEKKYKPTSYNFRYNDVIGLCV